MRVLVTGGAGYIGSVSVEALLAAGHEPIILDDASTGHPGAVPPGVPYLHQDYTDEAAAADALRTYRVEAILHCAARSLVGESVTDPSRYFRQNVVGGIGLLEAARAEGVNRFVFSSTAAVYGTPDVTPIRDFVHVLDIAQAHVRALEATEQDDAGGLLICNLGSGSGFSVREVLAAAEAVVGRPIPVRVGPRRPGDPPILVARVDRSRDTLGWTAQHGTLQAMIESAWAWRRRHPRGYQD